MQPNSFDRILTAEAQRVQIFISAQPKIPVLNKNT